MATLKEVLQAVIDERSGDVERRFPDGFRPMRKWTMIISYLEYDVNNGTPFDPDKWRVISAIKQPKRRVEWTRKDVPPLCWLRLKGSGRARLVVDVDGGGVGFDGETILWWELMADYEYSTTLEQGSWRGCFVEVD